MKEGALPVLLQAGIWYNQKISLSISGWFIVVMDDGRIPVAPEGTAGSSSSSPGTRSRGCAADAAAVAGNFVSLSRCLEKEGVRGFHVASRWRLNRARGGDAADTPGRTWPAHPLGTTELPLLLPPPPCRGSGVSVYRSCWMESELLDIAYWPS